MTIEEIEDTLPNGFHDAQIKSINLNYLERTTVIGMSLWVGDLDSSDKTKREDYRPGALTISDFDLCVIEPPDPKYPYMGRKSLTVGSGSGNPPHVSLREQIPTGAFAYWFFVNQWNSFIYFVARAARLDVSKDGP